MAGGSMTGRVLFGICAILCILIGLTNAYLDGKTFVFAAFDNTITVAVDGVPATGLPQYTAWPSVYSVDIPPMAKVITLTARARYLGPLSIPSPSALLSFLANTTVSYDNWKCKDRISSTAWVLPSYNDSSWDKAPVADPFLVQILMVIFQENPCTQCDPAAQWVGYVTPIGSPYTIYCRIHLPFEQAPTTIDMSTVSPGTIRPQVNAPEFVYRVDESDTKISSLVGCIRKVRSRISCARICTQQKEFCEGFQHGGPDELCCPMNTDAMQYGVRLSAVGFNIWRVVLY